MDQALKKRVELATVKVLLKEGGKGLGVYIGNGLILTAAHCVEFTCTGGMVLGDYHVVTIETSTGQALKVAPLAIEPLNDIAVLGNLDDQVFYDESTTFDKFCDETEPVPVYRKNFPSHGFEIKEAEIPFRTEDEEWTWKKQVMEVSETVHVYTHEKTWVTGKVTYLLPFNRAMASIQETEIKSGTSGGPVVNQSGEIVGIVSTFGSLRIGSFPRPHLALPVWVCNQIWSDELLKKGGK